MQNQQTYMKKSQEYDQAHHAFLAEKGAGGANKGPKELQKQEKVSKSTDTKLVITDAKF